MPVILSAEFSGAKLTLTRSIDFYVSLSQEGDLNISAIIVESSVESKPPLNITIMFASS